MGYPTLCDLMDCSPPSCFVHGDNPGKNTGVGCHASSRGSSQPRYRTQVFCITGGFFTIWATREAQEYWSGSPIPSPGELPDPGIELGSLALQADSLWAELLKKPTCLLKLAISPFISRMSVIIYWSTYIHGNTRPPDLLLEKSVCRSGSKS